MSKLQQFFFKSSNFINFCRGFKQKRTNSLCSITVLKYFKVMNFVFKKKSFLFWRKPFFLRFFKMKRFFFTKKNKVSNDFDKPFINYNYKCKFNFFPVFKTTELGLFFS